jgi:hypothetical protein
MLSGVMEHFGLSKSFAQAEGFCNFARIVAVIFALYLA